MSESESEYSDEEYYGSKSKNNNQITDINKWKKINGYNPNAKVYIVKGKKQISLY